MKDRVTYSFGLTINTGNYESVRVDVTMASDVEGNETFDEAYERVKSVVQDKVEEEHDDIKRDS